MPNHEQSLDAEPSRITDLDVSLKWNYILRLNFLFLKKNFVEKGGF